MTAEIIGVLFNKPQKFRSDIRGFTMIENLISVLLLGVTLCAGMMLYYNGDEIVALATHKKFVTETINSKMEDIRASGYDSIEDPGYVDVDYFTIGGLQVQQIMTVSNPPDGATDYKQIDIQASWTEAGSSSTRTITLTSLVAP